MSSGRRSSTSTPGVKPEGQQSTPQRVRGQEETHQGTENPSSSSSTSSGAMSSAEFFTSLNPLPSSTTRRGSLSTIRRRASIGGRAEGGGGAVGANMEAGSSLGDGQSTFDGAGTDIRPDEHRVTLIVFPNAEVIFICMRVFFDGGYNRSTGQQ